MEVVLLGHKARSGKDTLAEMLVTNDKFIRVGFADAIKDYCMQLFDLSVKQVYGDLKEVPDERYEKSSHPVFKEFYTPREILQKAAQDLKEIDENIWVRMACKKIDKFVDPKVRGVVIPDFRFPIEYQMVKNHCIKKGYNFSAYRIDRENKQSISGSQHISETALDNFSQWDGIIKNNGTFEELYNNFWSATSKNT